MPKARQTKKRKKKISTGSATSRRPAPPLPSVAIFAEGPTYEDPSRDAFEKLWTGLCAVVGVTREVRVIGFSKSHLVKMAAPPGIQIAAAQPLHLLVAQHYTRKPFDRAVIAFDAAPPNQHLLPAACMRTEVNFVLQHFAACTALPSQLRQAANALLGTYAKPVHQRMPTRQPLALEVIYMDPKFEALLASDEPTVRRALLGAGVRRPPEWPAFGGTDPEQHVIAKAIECAAEDVHAIVRGTFKSNKHGWAEYIVRHARAGCDLLQHEIASRLSVVAA